MAWRKLKAIPDDTEIKGFQWWPQEAQDVKKEIMAALMRRINLRGKLKECRGRKDSEQYMTSLKRDQQRIREIVTSCIRHYQFESIECKKRFSHLLSDLHEI